MIVGFEQVGYWGRPSSQPAGYLNSGRGLGSFFVLLNLVPTVNLGELDFNHNPAAG